MIALASVAAAGADAPQRYGQVDEARLRGSAAEPQNWLALAATAAVPTTRRLRTSTSAT